jgi:nucleotide-binding universal stress UspA family protein
MLPIGTILHPTDFSDCATHAFRVAGALARDHGARLVVLHVAPLPVVVYGEGVVPPQPEVTQAELDAKLHQLQAPDPKVRVEHRLAEGDAATEILRAAEETSCDMVVMGTHGRTGLVRLLMGSVAEQVVRKAPCPVLTVKTPLPAARLRAEAAPEKVGRLAGPTGHQRPAG